MRAYGRPQKDGSLSEQGAVARSGGGYVGWVLNRCEGLKVGCSVGTKERRLETQARSCKALQFVFRVLTFSPRTIRSHCWKGFKF